eukprot:scaffold880_cov132-Cylindrotheca_fusiformis.AAC.45
MAEVLAPVSTIQIEKLPHLLFVRFTIINHSTSWFSYLFVWLCKLRRNDLVFQALCSRNFERMHGSVTLVASFRQGNGNSRQAAHPTTQEYLEEKTAPLKSTTHRFGDG